MKDRDFSVGEVAKRCGVNVSTLHFYEKKGLIQSLRNGGNQRRYKKDVFRQVSVIKAAQKMGISLQEIATEFATLPNNRRLTMADWQRLSRHWQQGLNDRITYLERLRDSLTGCIGCGCLSMENCPIYNLDDKLSAEGSGPLILNRPIDE